VSELGKSLARPERFIGTHFFNPAYKMKLVEVTPAGFTDKVVTERVIAFLRDAGRVPVVVKDSPGFLVNRMLLPYLNEAARMIEEGFLIKDIDSAMLDFGMPVGPIKLIDDIGSKVAYKACKILEGNFKDRIRVPDTLKAWSEKKRTPSFPGKAIKKGSDRGIVSRLLKPMKTEAVLCLKEGIADHREVIDLALLLGAGFPVSKRIWNI
jgi:3-hydroxyacyl-CoA dehydrogenase / enoyl-CoA hydratase / 3-hydroxybutyryl-CoA epimerase